ncbi:MAG TPA: hypothetical protein VGC97_00585 [Pyrinomonadaceae bacterium]
MSLSTLTEINNTQIPFGQTGSLISSSGIIRKQSVEQIADTEVSYCNFSFSDFDNIFRFEITDIIWDEFSEKIIFKLEYGDYFFVYLQLNGYWELENEQRFQLTDVDWYFEEKENTPISAFAVETFKVILCLTNKVKIEIPSIDYWVGVSVPLPLNSISEILQNRQLAYRLMVIEKAFQISLTFPRRFIAGEEVENIAFCYHAIIDRQFEWTVNSFTFFPTADEENLKYLPLKNTSYHLTFPTLNEIRVIFNHQLHLGQFLIEVEKAIVENYDEVKEAFSKLDGNPVKVIIKSLNGKVRYETLNVPGLPKRAWKTIIQDLIDLTGKFNAVFLERYFKLAASTLEGLSKEQKESITERPKLSIKGFD